MGTTEHLKDDPDYYAKHQDKFVKDFDKQSGAFRRILVERHGEAEADTIVDGARDEFVTVLPQMAYIGGGGNPMTEYLVGSAVVLGFYKVLSARGMSDEEVGEFCYQVSAHRFDDDNAIERWVTKEVGFTKPYWVMVAEYAKKHPYPGGWACEMVDCKGTEWDWGIDMTKCGVCKLYEEQGAGDFAKWACPSDFAMTRALHVGMERTMTLSEGAPKCDFRFKKGLQTRLDWPPTFWTPASD